MSYSKIKSILLVDDDQDDLYFFSKALEKFDVEIDLITAIDGILAIEKLESKIPDVILLDLNMPRMNGMAFLRFIKKAKHLKNVPVIIYTTRINIFDETEALKLGAYAVFIKPAEFYKTVETISEILGMNFIRMTG